MGCRQTCALGQLALLQTLRVLGQCDCSRIFVSEPKVFDIELCHYQWPLL